jgi:hypothetical protein
MVNSFCGVAALVVAIIILNDYCELIYQKVAGFLVRICKGLLFRLSPSRESR